MKHIFQLLTVLFKCEELVDAKSNNQFDIFISKNGMQLTMEHYNNNTMLVISSGQLKDDNLDCNLDEIN